MQGPGAIEIACADGTLTIFASRLLMRGRVAWALQIAEMCGVSCLRQGDGCVVGLHVTDRRQFIVRGVTNEDALRLIEMFGYVPIAEPSGRAELVPYGAGADVASEADDIELHAAGLGGTLFITRRRILFVGPSPWVLPRRAVAAVVPKARGAICDLAIVTDSGQRGDILGLACEDALRTMEMLAVVSSRERAAAHLPPSAAATTVRPAAVASRRTPDGRLAAPARPTMPLARTDDTLLLPTPGPALPITPSDASAPNATTPTLGSEPPAQPRSAQDAPAPAPARAGLRPPESGRERPRHRVFWP